MATRPPTRTDGVTLEKSRSRPSGVRWQIQAMINASGKPMIAEIWSNRAICLAE
jgi:hypothetical protein